MSISLSGSYAYNPGTYQIITGALRLLSAIQSGEIPPDDEYQDALAALNGMTKAWQASGIHVWAEFDATLFFQPGQYLYQLGLGSEDFSAGSATWTQTTLTANAAAGATTIQVAAVTRPQATPYTASMAVGDIIGIWLPAGNTFWTTIAGISGLTVALTFGLSAAALSGAYVINYGQSNAIVRPLKIPAARRFQFASAGSEQPIETPMMIMSRIDYFAQPQKSVPGIPTQWFYDPAINSNGLTPASPLGNMYVWPAPVNNLSAMKFTVQRPLADFVTQSNTADFPQEWISALRFNLAAELALEYDTPPQRFQMIKALADEKFEAVKGWDREPEPVLFGVAYDPTSRV